MWSCEGGGLNHVAWELKHVLYILYAYQVFNEMAKGINSHFFYSLAILQGWKFIDTVFDDHVFYGTYDVDGN